MKIEKYVNSIAMENTYLLTADDNSQLLIDPGSDLEYLSYLTKPVAVLLTHAHFDHIMGLSVVSEKFPDLPIWLAKAEKDWPHLPEFNASALMLGKPVIAPEATDFFGFDEPLEIADFQLEVRATPGHSIGSVSFVFADEKIVFSGDALFKGSIGRTDLPTGNFDQLIDAIKTQLFTLPDEFRVYPGHGPHTTLSEEKVFNPFF